MKERQRERRERHSHVHTHTLFKRTQSHPPHTHPHTHTLTTHTHTHTHTQVLDQALREDFGFEHLLVEFVYVQNIHAEYMQCKPCWWVETKPYTLNPKPQTLNLVGTTRFAGLKP
jgi:hypothetical protein